MKINLREPSTKRGIAMIITGCTVLYQTIWGSGQMNIDALFSRVDWWLGVGLNIVGMFGLLPDSPPRNPQERTRATDLPPIELQGQSETPTADRLDTPPDQLTRTSSDAWMHDPVPSQSGFQHAIQSRPGAVGWSDDS